MSFERLILILMARRIFIGLCTLSCVVGAVIVCLIVPPIWEAHARVLLKLLEPDPVTGVPSSAAAGGMQAQDTQAKLITDPVVTTKVVDTLNLAADPAMIEGYASRSKDDARDFRSWAAGAIARGTKVKMLGASNILDISYSASSPRQAASVVGALQRAYVDNFLSMKTTDAARTADWYETELSKLRKKLTDAIQAEAVFEKSNNIAMANDHTDVESQRLQSLASAGPPLLLPPEMVNSSKASQMELASVEAQIAAASKSLGPNNPQMQELMRKRSELKSLVAQDEAAANAAIAATRAGSSVSTQQLAAQQSKVIANTDKLGQLQSLQQDVELRRNDYQTAAQKFAQYRAQADQQSAGTISPLPVTPPDTPVFPNWLLIMPLSLIGGLMTGVLVALLMEALNRRVRSADDLLDDLDIPVLGVIAESGEARTGWLRPSREAGSAKVAA